MMYRKRNSHQVPKMFRFFLLTVLVCMLVGAVVCISYRKVVTDVQTSGGMKATQLRDEFSQQVKKYVTDELSAVGITNSTQPFRACYVYNNPAGPGFAESPPELLCSVEFTVTLAEYPNTTDFISTVKDHMRKVSRVAERNGFSSSVSSSASCSPPEFEGVDNYWNGKAYVALPCYTATKGDMTSRTTITPKCYVEFMHDSNSYQSDKVDFYLKTKCYVRAAERVSDFVQYQEGQP